MPEHVVACPQPGRLIIAAPTIWASVLGDMASLAPPLVRIAALHAASMNAPRALVEFLEVCASNNLSLCKYVVKKTT